MEHSPSFFATDMVILAFVWWKWVLLVLAGFVVLAWLALKSYRRLIRKKLVCYLKENYPELEVVSEHSNHLMIRTSGGEVGQMNLQNLFRHLADANVKTPEDEQAAFKKLAGGIVENIKRASRTMSLQEDGDFLLPRLENAPDLASLMARGKIIHQPLADTGLSVVYVRDSEEAVSFLPETALAELGVDLAALHERALANLRKKSGPDFVRQAIEGKTISLLKLGDTFDAARVLLVPEYLQEGEAVAAIISDRDTLAVGPLPADDDWKALSKLARATDGPPLLNRPLKITRNGFELMGGEK